MIKEARKKHLLLEVEEDLKEGQKRAWMILQVLSGAKRLSEVTEEAGISMTRYYQLEEKAIQALVLSLSPQETKQKSCIQERLRRAEAKIDKLEREKKQYSQLRRVARKFWGEAAFPGEKNLSEKKLTDSLL